MPRGGKNHKGIAKRFTLSKNDKMRGKKCGYHHKQVKKSGKRTRFARLGVRVKGKTRRNFLYLLSR